MGRALHRPRPSSPARKSAPSSPAKTPPGSPVRAAGRDQLRRQSADPDARDPRYQLLADQTSDAVFLLDATSLRIMDANQVAASLSGYHLDDLLGRYVGDLLPENRRDSVLARIVALTDRFSSFAESQLLRRDGAVIPIEVREQRLKDGRVLAVVREAGHQGLAEAHLHQMLGGIDLLAATLDREGRISYANPALSALTGWSSQELIGRSAFDLLHSGPEGDGIGLVTGLATATLQRPLAAEILTRSGARRPIAVSATPIRDGEGRTVGTAVLGQDITDEHSSFTALQALLRERSEVADALGRLQSGDTLEESMAAICNSLHGLTGVDMSCVVVFDSTGGANVVAYQSEAASPLVDRIPLPETRAAYLMERATQGAWTEPWLPRAEYGEWNQRLTDAGVRNTSYAPIRHGDTVLGVLVVVSIFGGEPTGEVAEAYLPMIAEFGAAASALLAGHLQADRVAARSRSEIAAILETGAFQPVFQPIVDLRRGRTVGYEALTRFSDGLPPDQRFATAWTVGLGPELEIATLQAAIGASDQLPRGTWLNVNASPRLLEHPDQLREVVHSTARPVVLEITEHEVITDYGAVREALAGLGAVRTAVDDAGAGTANFAHVIELQPDFVKLDIGLVRGIDSDLARQAMVVAMRHFALATGCRLIAEGVETEAEAATVKTLGADLGQGYWYGRPAAAETLPAREKVKRPNRAA